MGRYVAAALACVLVGVLSLGASAQVPDGPRYAFQQVGVDEGLGTRGVVAITQDGDGLLWVGTLDRLFRYDGQTLRAYSVEEGLPSPYVIQLVTAPDGVLWVVTSEGIVFWDGIGFVAIDMSFEAGAGERKRLDGQRIAFDGQNNLYVASIRGLAKIGARDRASVQLWTGSDGLPDEEVTAVTTEGDRVWFGCGGRVGVLDGGKIEMLPASVGIPDEEIRTVLVAPDGTLWVRTVTHLARRDPGETLFVLDDEGVPKANIYGQPSLDRSGSLLLPTLGGLFTKEGDRWSVAGEESGLVTGVVSAAYEDHEGALWLGLGGAGLVRWPGRRSWSAWTVSEGLPDNTVWGSHRDGRGRLWVATNSGVAVWDPAGGKWHLWGEKDGVAGDVIWHFAEDPEGWVWSVSSSGTLTRFEPETLSPQRVEWPEGHVIQRATMDSGPDGTIWIGTHDTLHRISVSEGEIAFEAVALPGGAQGLTQYVELAPDGVVWTGGPQGLGRYDGKEWMRFDSGDGLKNDSVTELASVSGDEVWVLYRNLVGLTRLRVQGEEAEVTHFGVKDGFPSDTFYALGIDSEGRICAGGNSGVSVLDGDVVRTYDRHDGLIWDDLSGHGFLAEPGGAFFLGTSRGLAYYRPVEEGEPPAPRALLTSVSMGGRVLKEREGIEVPYGDRDLTLAYACTTFRNPSAVRFRHRLVGMDDEPIETSMRELRYSALPRGTYRFEVSCVSARGRWSEAPATFSFTVLTPWWVSWWAVAGAGGLLAILVLVLALAIVRFRTRKLEADRSRLEKAVAERSQELAEANEELKELSFTDVLTSTRNRRYFMDVIEDDVSRVLRRYDERSGSDTARNKGLIFLIVDLDWFKKVNDTMGHKAGDEVLAEVGERLQGVLRSSDLLVRWGGEEFLIVSRDSDPTEGDGVAKRILAAIGKEPFEVAKGKKTHRTCSVGWAPFPWSGGDPAAASYESVLELADKALYEAKGSGRNNSVGVLPVEGGEGVLPLERGEGVLPVEGGEGVLPLKRGEGVLPVEGGEGEMSQWLEKPLVELEGKQVRLVRSAGP